MNLFYRFTYQICFFLLKINPYRYAFKDYRLSSFSQMLNTVLDNKIYLTGLIVMSSFFNLFFPESNHDQSHFTNYTVSPFSWSIYRFIYQTSKTNHCFLITTYFLLQIKNTLLNIFILESYLSSALAQMADFQPIASTFSHMILQKHILYSFLCVFVVSWSNISNLPFQSYFLKHV